jgi:hypothetical protein
MRFVGRPRAAGLAGWERLAIGSEARFIVATATATATTATAATAATSATSAVATEARAAITAIAAGATAATRAAGSARSTVTAVATGPTRSAGSTRSTGAASRSAATSTLAAEVARRRGELPADPGAWHLSATRPVVVFRLILLRAVHEATEAARLVASIAAGSTSTSTSTPASPAAAAAATVAAIATAAAVTAAAIVTAPALRRRHPIDGVVVLAARDRAVRPLLALEHAHEADLVETVADDIERLDHAGSPVRLDPQCAGDRVDDRIGFVLDRRVGCGVRRRVGSNRRTRFRR